MKRHAIVITFLLLITNLLSAQETINVLFLGNSYVGVNNLPQLCADLAVSSGRFMKTASNTPGGHLLIQHATNNLSLNKIREGMWDFVVLQEQSQLPTIDYYRYEFMYPGYQALCDSVAAYNADAQVVGYMTWGRRFGGQQCEDYGDGLYCSADFVDFNHMQDSLTSAYNACRELFGGITAPVGEAWRKALEESKIVLHSGDDSHPTIEGSYLAACVFHAVFFDESPLGLWHPESIGDRTAQFLQNIAAEIVLQPSAVNETNDIRHGFNIHVANNEIIISSKKNTNASISVIDIFGKEIKRSVMNDINICKISSCDISKGLVILKIKDEMTSETATFKLIIQ